MKTFLFVVCLVVTPAVLSLAGLGSNYVWAAWVIATAAVALFLSMRRAPRERAAPGPGADAAPPEAPR